MYYYSEFQPAIYNFTIFNHLPFEIQVIHEVDIVSLYYLFKEEVTWSQNHKWAVPTFTSML